MKAITSTNSHQTFNLGKETGRCISQKVSIALVGDLGAGKTTFVQGLARGLGVSKDLYVTSPSFSIINEYPAGLFTLCHLDLYRLGSADELEFIGFDDLIEDDRIIVVEWPDILEEISFEFDLQVCFKFDARYNRIISFFASGQVGSNLLSKLFL
jgi:tRNA threonylcarbamoyladenosine biosynthesis protein TsaE